MSQSIVAAMLLLFATAPTLAQKHADKYRGAAIGQAGDIPYPLNSRQPGFVSFDVIVDSSGAIKNMAAVRDLAPFTSAAENAIQSWQFKPATRDGQAIDGVVQINVAFNPFNPSGVGLPGEPLQPPASAVIANFQPAYLQSASYARYPPNTVSYGTVVLKVPVASDGSAGEITVVAGKPDLNRAAIAAAKNWTFAAATYKGKPIQSDTYVVFVFVLPAMGTG